MASQIMSYLPTSEGLLPKWLLLVSIIAIGNSIQAYTTLTYTRRVYNGTRNPSSTSTSKPSKASGAAVETAAYSSTSPVTPLSARTFGTWTFLSAIVRLYAAYHVNEKAVYELAFWTYGLAFAHFMSEWFVFGTCKAGAGVAGPAIVSSVSLVWMWVQWGFYVGN